MRSTINSKTRKSSSFDDDDQDISKDSLLNLLPLKKPFQCYVTQYSAREIHYYISNDIGEPSEYIELIHTLNTASPQDVIYFHLNTPGGQLDTGLQIINAMNNTNATVITVLDGNVASLGTLIFLSGHELIVNEHSMMMFHNFRGGAVGKGNEIVSQIDAIVKMYAALARKIYIPFITAEEFERISKGEDFWFQSDEIKERVQRLADFKMKEVDQEPETQVLTEEKTPKRRRSKTTS